MKTQVRVDPDDHEKALKLKLDWEAARMGSLPLKALFREGLERYAAKLRSIKKPPQRELKRS